MREYFVPIAEDQALQKEAKESMVLFYNMNTEHRPMLYRVAETANYLGCHYRQIETEADFKQAFINRDVFESATFAVNKHIEIKPDGTGGHMVINIGDEGFEPEDLEDQQFSLKAQNRGCCLSAFYFLCPSFIGYSFWSTTPAKSDMTTVNVDDETTENLLQKKQSH